MLRRIGVLIVFFLFMCGVAGVTMYMLSKAEDGVKDDFAPFWAAELIVEHLKSNEDRWPASWEDLRITWDFISAEGWKYGDQPFEDMQKRVVVDFGADAGTVASSAGAPRLVSRAKSPEEEFTGEDPNTRIHDYLRKKYDPTQPRGVSGLAE